MKNLKEQYTRFFGPLTEQKVYVDAIEWYGSRSEASGFANKHKLKMDSFGYSGGHNTFGLKGDKKNLIKAFMSDEFSKGSLGFFKGKMRKLKNKSEVLKMFPELK
tara:strand:+ start:424 stop:738 length:315 start_codon:yes stop_codon:yes gene_type:complete